MCLVFISVQTNGKGPLKIGANREESRRRPATSPVCCKQARLRCLLAGADHGPDGVFPAIGTWLGVNESGMAVAVTNRHDGELSSADQVRSRGLLAVSLLDIEVPDRTVRFAESALAMGGYGGCNFLIANAESAFVVQAPGRAAISVTRLEPGTHAMTNLDLDDDDPRINLVRATLDPANFIASAARLCRDDRIVVAGGDRGTVSSSLIVVSDDIVLYHIQGDPSRRPYERYRLLDQD